MKLITFAIPSYNSENYLAHAVNTILSGGEAVEILIVDDGSTDGTARIADAFAAKYPTIVRAIHKPNGGHGSGVNRGLREAQGLYYKVVDSDDWVDEKALRELLLTIQGHLDKGLGAELYITNLIYDHLADGTQFVRGWKQHLPENRFCTWKDAKSFYGAQVMMMHSLLYKTQMLRESGMVLPEHTFYVDNIYAYQPLPHMKRIFYLNVNLYHYFIGRDDQSVNINNFTKRYDQQIRVMKLLLEAYRYDTIMSMEKGLQRYMLHYLSALMVTTMMFCCSGGDDPQRQTAYAAMWDWLKDTDPKLWGYLRHKALPALTVWMPWKLRGSVMLTGYKILCKTVKLG